MKSTQCLDIINFVVYIHLTALSILYRQAIAAKLSMLIITPPATTQGNPRIAITYPHPRLANVVPKLTAVRKSPFTKSGASGADVYTQYCVTLALIPAAIPHITIHIAESHTLVVLTYIPI